ncbi:MAG TPA: hypothetical protein VLU73_13120 [Methylococcaceae bacterium]|jgi:hypothetical protein|nr:hypothetical protein [Methylococcaceae bacterium]
MIEPVALQDFFITFFSAAMVILSGAGYAALYAWSKLSSKPGILICAYGCYALLAGAVFVLADSANLGGSWRIVVGLMLAGYLLAPHGIWRLCADTHAAEHDDEER